MVTEGEKISSSATRMLAQSEDPKVNHISISENGNYLLMAASQTVRIWDLRKLEPISKLNTGHSSYVNCVCQLEDSGKWTVITGSKDHYVKCFELPMNDPLSPIYHSTYFLTPPHYDSVEALAACSVNGQRFAFSASRDAMIKRFDLENGTQVNVCSTVVDKVSC